MCPRWLQVIRLSEYMDLKTNDKADPKCASENTPKHTQWGMMVGYK